MASSPEIGRQNPHQQAKWLAMILKPSLNKTMLERLYHNRFFFFEYQCTVHGCNLRPPILRHESLMDVPMLCSALAVVNGHHICVMNDGALCRGISAAALAKTTSSCATCTMFSCSKAENFIFSHFMWYLFETA